MTTVDVVGWIDEYTGRMLEGEREIVKTQSNSSMAFWGQKKKKKKKKKDN
jgi:hypothetical protein